VTRQDGSAVGERRRDLASLSLLADLSYPELEAVAHTFAEEAFAKDQRVLRQDVSGGSFYVILSGAARVVIDGEERAALSRGDFFGEISVLTDTAPTDCRGDPRRRASDARCRAPSPPGSVPGGASR
jgi:CRP-like cAMP-binding protein